MKKKTRDDKIKEMRRKGRTYKYIAFNFGLSYTRVHEIVNGIKQVYKKNYRNAKEKRTSKIERYNKRLSLVFENISLV